MKNKSVHAFMRAESSYCMHVLMLLILYFFTAQKSYCQLLSYTNATDGTLASTAVNTTGTALIRANGANAPGSPCSTGFSSANFSNTATYNSALAAVETSVIPSTGYILNITGFTAAMRRSSSGPASVRYAYSADGGSTWIAQSTDQSVPSASCGAGAALSWPVSFSVTAPNSLRFRIYGFNAGNTAGTEQVLNLMINGSVTPVNGSCSVPSFLFASGITTSSANLNWDIVSGAASYKVQYRVTGTTTWTTLTAASNSKTVSGLTASTAYQYRVKSVCSGSSSAYSPISTFTTTGTVTLPVPDHIVILILENHSYSSIIGSSAAPHINALASDTNSALFTQSFGIEHPSQPNYLDLFSGSNQGVTNDNVPANNPFTTPNLARELVDASHSFTTFSESLPSVGYNGATSGSYARKHNPAANWMGTGANQISATTNQPFTAFPSSSNYASLPTVSYIIPNQANDMHNGSDPARITTADNWMFNNLNGYIQWAKTHNSLFILTFDEDDNSHSNQITTIFTGPMVLAGQYANRINHYNVLRTIEDMYSLPYAGNASSQISFCWKQGQLANLVCDTTLWNHVYNSYRLQVNQSCITITGVVDHLIYEPDGDIHIRLHVDTPYTNMLNSVNISSQYGDLVLEPVCATTVTQSDAVSSCQNFSNQVYIPNVGEHVRVSGSYVTDLDHGWNEIHPVTGIAIIPPRAGNPGVATGVNTINVYPNPAASFIYFRFNEALSAPALITISDASGKSAGQYQVLESLSLKVNTGFLPSGNYYYSITQNNRVLKSGNFIIHH